MHGAYIMQTIFFTDASSQERIKRNANTIFIGYKFSLIC